jgi:hypothetical protein
MLGESMLLVDGGNIHGPRMGPEFDREAAFILKVMEHQGYDVAAFGPKDYSLPEATRSALLGEARFPWVASNYRQPPPGVGESFIRKVDGLKVAVFSYADPDYTANNLDSNRVVDNLDRIARSLRSKADVVVMVAHTSNRDPETLARRVDGLVDVMILGGVSTAWTAMRQEGGVLIGNSGDRGREIARFELLLNREKTIVESKYEVVKLVHDVHRDPLVAQWMLDFNAAQAAAKDAEIEEMRQTKLAELGLKSEDMPGHGSELRYTGEKDCRECHREIYNAWRRTEHGRAYSDLIRSRESHLEDKVRRTVTGWMEETGFIDRRESSHLYNVQCESCHGRGSAHVASEGKALETLIRPEQTCVACHSPEQDPGFDLRSALLNVHDVSQAEDLEKQSRQAEQRLQQLGTTSKIGTGTK